MVKEKLRKESYNKDRPEEEAGFRILCRYVFGNSSQDARHWDKYLLKVLQEQKETLSGLFAE